MADLDTSSGGGKKGPGVKKGKKLSTRVDLTPMVDLGFLLITFFIFTTTMSQPTAMKLFLPKDTDKQEEQNKVKESGALSIMLANDGKIFYYEGALTEDGSNFEQTNFNDIRSVIVNKKRSTDPEDFVVVLKPTPDATYKNIVDILDEMSINEVKRYALVEIFPQELDLIRASGGLSN